MLFSVLFSVYRKIRLNQAKHPCFIDVFRVERVKGIEPSSQPWEGHILPLNHTRNVLLHF